MKGFRTIIANALFMVLPVLEMSELVAVIPDEWLPWYALGMALANMVLRYITTTPVGQSDAD